MRDPVDNRTAELLDVEPKRRPGRPRKPGAMTNAERQAAYRARLKADGISTYARPGVPDLVHRHADADELEELRAELDSTKAELDEAHETIDELSDQARELRHELEEAQASAQSSWRRAYDAETRLAKLEKAYAALEKAAMKPAPVSVTRNEKDDTQWNPAMLAAMAKKESGKSVTRNEN